MYKFRISKNYTVVTKTKSKIEARQVWAAAVQQAKEEEFFDYISVKEADIGGESSSHCHLRYSLVEARERGPPCRCFWFVIEPAQHPYYVQCGSGHHMVEVRFRLSHVA